MADCRSFKNSDPDEFTLRVLVADDNTLNRALMEAMLAEFGCAVTQVENGEEASSLAAIEAFDLIIMDLRMPVLDGDGATKRIRADGASQRAFIVRWSTEGDRRLNGALYDGELPKPLSCSPLVAAVSLASRRALYRADAAKAGDERAPEDQRPRF